MEQALAGSMSIAGFDDRSVRWMPYPGLDGMWASVLHVDPARNEVDFLVRFGPQTKTVIHHHLAMTHILVIAGEHVIYEPDGTVRDVRPAGRYTAGLGGDPHDEGGGPDGAVLFYSVRGGDSDVLFEVHDPAGIAAPAIIRTADFTALLAAQGTA
ncbi:MAG: regulator [Pseudomonadota bacterium]